MSVRNVTVLVVPEEKVSVILVVDFNVSIGNVSVSISVPVEIYAYPACILSNGPSGAPGKDLTK